MPGLYICVRIIYILLILCIIYQGSVVVGFGDGEDACEEYIVVTVSLFAHLIKYCAPYAALARVFLCTWKIFLTWPACTRTYTYVHASDRVCVLLYFCYAIFVQGK